MIGASIRFLGAARTVTGSRFLVDAAGTRLLVDCGLYQGRKDLRLRNWAPFPVDPASIDAIVLTHAHVDHCGFIPALVRDGFVGPVMGSPATTDLAAIVLPDSGRLHEEDAAYANRKGFSKHAPALPLYTEADALRCLGRFEPSEFGETRTIGGLSLTLRPAGHILGSATVTIEGAGEPIVFSGDLGRPHHPLLCPPAPPAGGATIVIESTYGDRVHDDAGAAARFEAALRTTFERGGVAVIPAFAVDRTEVVLHLIARLMADRRIEQAPVWIDSPMALRALDVYRRYERTGAADLRPGIEHLEPPHALTATKPEESKALNALKGPAVIVSASGMATGGRVLHHLLHRLPNPRDTVILVGYQAEGTRGRRLLDGEPHVKMLGTWVGVRASVVDCTGLSVHADRRELLGWLRSAARPRRLLVVHGEERAAAALAHAASGDLGLAATVPALDEVVEIT
jgi:metallo-beta-lactamase family protein